MILSVISTSGMRKARAHGIVGACFAVPAFVNLFLSLIAARASSARNTGSLNQVAEPSWMSSGCVGGGAPARETHSCVSPCAASRSPPPRTPRHLASLRRPHG